MALAKADFYYGALLSQLVNSGFAPAIIERGDTRRIYQTILVILKFMQSTL